MDEMRAWVDEQARENLRFHIQNAEVIKKEATDTLTVFLAGIGGASAYTVKLIDTHAAVWLLAASIAFAGSLLLLAAWVILGCLKIKAIPAPSNEPRNLYRPYFSLPMLKEVELENVQDRIDEAVKRNVWVADRLNRIRLFALSTPIIAAMAAAVVAWVQSEGEHWLAHVCQAAAVGWLVWVRSLLSLC